MTPGGPVHIPERPVPGRSSPWQVFTVFLVLGLTSFGGPVAHLGYFRDAFVTRRRWLDERAYADLVALCQFLPGPASSQVGMAIGLHRAGYRGLVAAWLGFTLPSAVLLVAFALGVGAFDVDAGSGWLRGLTAGAVGVVAHAVAGMARTLAPDRRRAGVAVLAFAVALLVPSAGGQVLAIGIGALVGLLWLPDEDRGREPDDGFTVRVGRRHGLVFLGVFVVLLAGLPVAAAVTANPGVDLVAGFYRTGSLVFGGGHVVLPLLEAETVQRGLVDDDVFLAGYAAAQAVPGPLFTFAGFLGAASATSPAGVLGAVLALVSIFAPSALLVLGGVPFWARLRRVARARTALAGVGAAVVGLLGAALYDPVFTAGVTSSASMIVAVAAFVALTTGKAPAWAVVAASAVTGAVVL